MVARALQRRLFTTTTQPWSSTQVTKSNFTESLTSLSTHIHSSDYIAISSSKTGGGTLSSPSPWTRCVHPYLDTSHTSYLKSKYAAEKFQIFQFMICPFSISKSDNLMVEAHPYNFHLFPKDEMSVGMPEYSFSCQTSNLTSMARQGFDFNTWIYDGISYLSRAQESTAKLQLGNDIGHITPTNFSSARSVADSVFMERIKTRVTHWRNACKDKSKGTEEALVKSLRKLILGGELYGSRPCMSVDVCNEHQVQLVLEILSDCSDDLVPVIVPEQGGGTKAVRVVLTSSEEDKCLLKAELRKIEEERNRKLSGFREVIDMISASQKPIVVYNCLEEFSFIHSKFLSPLPSTVNEFMSSLRAVFPKILDVNYLLKEVGPLKKANNMHSAISHLKRQFFIPLDMKIPSQAQGEEGKNYGHNVLYTAYVFAKLSSILKITPDTNDYINIFSPISGNLEEQIDKDDLWAANPTKVSTKELVFIWGFRKGMSANELKSLLHEGHGLFSKEFGVRLVDKSCAIIRFKKPGCAEEFIKVMDSGGLKKLVSDGVKIAGYEAYERVCELSFFEMDLADSLDEVLARRLDDIFKSNLEKEKQVYWSSDSIVLDEI
ncbi:poly(A)-specific ribonuclease [Ranunculus cassubicifolius]